MLSHKHPKRIQSLAGRSAIARAVETLERRVLMSTTLTEWTFETSQPTGSGSGLFPAAGYSAEVGTGKAYGDHANSATAYSTPVGNGSAHSFSSNTWSVGDFYEFETSTAGQGSISFSWDQTSSGTGPKSFTLEYSIDGGNTFTAYPGSIVNSAGNGTTNSGTYAVPGTAAFSSGTDNPVFTYSADFSSVTGVANNSAVYFRLADAAAPGGTGGTDRVDNVTVGGTTIAVPSIGTFSVSPTSVTQGANTPVALAASNITDANAGATITGVNFYAGSTTGAPIGAGTNSGGTWTLSNVSTASLSTGTETYYAIATDSLGFTSASVSTTLTINGAQQIGFDAATYSVNEAAGTVTIQVDRTGATSAASTVMYATSDGSHFTGSNPEVDGAAVAGTDYNSTSGTLTFAANQTTPDTFTVPILPVKTFSTVAGGAPSTRTFNVTLSSPTGGATLGSSTTSASTAVTITDNTVTAADGIDTPSGVTTYSYGVGANVANSFAALAYNNHNGYAQADFPEIEFGAGSTVFPGTYTAGAIDSVRLSLFNTAITGNFSGVPGSFDVYLLTNDTYPATSLTYAAGGDTGVAVLGSDTGAFADGLSAKDLVGTGVFTNNYVGYNDFTFDNLTSTVSTALTNYFNGNGADPIRFVIIPHSGSTISADWEGNFGTTEQPQLSLLVEKSNNIVENFSLGAAADTINKGSSDTITVNRTGNDITDTATVPYTLSGPDVNGTDYTVTDPSGNGNGTTTTSGVFNFAAGQTSASVTITALSTPVSADTTFSLTLGTPTLSGPLHVGNLESPTTEAVTIHDPNTTVILQSADDVSTVEPAGPTTTNPGEFVDVTYATEGAASSYGVADFNSSTSEGNGLQFSVPSTVGTINSVTLYTINAADSHTASGLLDVYLVSDSTTPIYAADGSPLTFSTADDPVEGLGTQLGTKYLLGSVNFSATQPTNSFTGFTLTGAVPSTLAMLASDLNNSLPFRIVMTPEDSSVEATWAGNRTATSLSGTINPNNDLEEPIIAFNYTPGVASSLPAWVSPNSQATYNASTNTLNVTGPTTIVADPAASSEGSVAIIASGSSAVINTSLPAGTAIHTGSVNLTGGALFSLNASSGTLLETSALSIDTTSQLDLGNGFLDVAGGSLATITAEVGQGYHGGLWNGDGITSSTAQHDSTHLTALGVIQNNQNGTPLFTASNFDGTTPGVSDILVRYTYFGDATLQGSVTGTDYSRIDSGVLTHATGWFNGDFNYDNSLNGSDYTLIDNAFNTQGAAITAAAIAPASSAAGKFSNGPAITFATPSAAADSQLVSSDLQKHKKTADSSADLLDSLNAAN